MSLMRHMSVIWRLVICSNSRTFFKKLFTFSMLSSKTFSAGSSIFYQIKSVSKSQRYPKNNKMRCISKNGRKTYFGGSERPRPSPLLATLRQRCSHLMNLSVNRPYIYRLKLRFEWVRKGFCFNFDDKID